MGTKMRRILL